MKVVHTDVLVIGGGLAGLRLAIIEGTIQAAFAQKHYPRSPLLLVANQEEAFDRLLAGKVDLVLSDTINLLDFLQQPKAAGYDFIGDTLVANDGDGRDADASDPGDWITSAESTGR